METTFSQSTDSNKLAAIIIKSRNSDKVVAFFNIGKSYAKAVFGCDVSDITAEDITNSGILGKMSNDRLYAVVKDLTEEEDLGGTSHEDY